MNDRMMRGSHLRARGSLSYPQFCRTVKRLWENAHPEVEIVSSGTDLEAKYPVIVRRLERRAPKSEERKPRMREDVNDGDGNYRRVFGQRFDNVVRFDIVTKSDPELAELVVEEFEDFMLEITPVLREMGASDLSYSRRYQDDERDLGGEDEVIRSVAYNLTIEKVSSYPVEKLEAIKVNVRTALSIEESREALDGEDPRFYSVGGIMPDFYVTPDSRNDGQIVIPMSNFRIGDVFYLAHGPAGEFPPEMDPGYYEVTDTSGVVYSEVMQYEITPRHMATPAPITTFGGGTANDKGYIYAGKVFYSPENQAFIELIDQNFTQTK